MRRTVGDGASAIDLHDRTLQALLVRSASLAPSVHNVQPARWRFGSDGSITCYHAVARALPAGDPTGRDVRLSLGAAIEGMALACASQGWHLEVRAYVGDGKSREWESTSGPTPSPTPSGLHPVALLRVVDGGVHDPLAREIEKRKSWRGRFVGDASAQLAALGHEDLFAIAREHLAEVARWHDDATWHFEQRPDYHAELWKWLRLSPSHPDWSRDGLNADALVLSPFERRVAGVLLRPPVFSALGRVGVGRVLVSEASAVRSASALLVFAPPVQLDDWSVGRRFFRAWLTATRAGLALAPMSALADWDETRGRIAELARIPGDRRVVNVFRAGLPPATARPEHVRLTELELMV